MGNALKTKIGRASSEVVSGFVPTMGTSMDSSVPRM
jgi:hypothetical protein